MYKFLSRVTKRVEIRYNTHSSVTICIRHYRTQDQYNDDVDASWLLKQKHKARLRCSYVEVIATQCIRWLSWAG